MNKVPMSVTCAALLALAGCAHYGQPEAPLSPQELLSGAALVPGQPAEPPPRAEDVIALDDEMRAFLQRHVSAPRTSDGKLRSLLAGMTTLGLSGIDYSLEATRTARETFYARQANCLSFTMLFMAFAREAGLQAAYQIVEVPPSWTSSEADLVISSNHINTLVRTANRSEYIVDFNLMQYQGNYPRYEITDDHVLALFYNNLGAEALVAGDQWQSFLYFKAALETYADAPGPWVNLGLLYQRQGLLTHAETAYLRALAADPRHGSALGNLVGLYLAMGEEERAEHYSRRARHYQQRNPYYHYVLARGAYEDGRLYDALDNLRRAIRLKGDEHEFHYLEGMVYLELDDPRKAATSLGRARDHAHRQDVRIRYDEKLRMLAGERTAAETLPSPALR